MDAGARTGSTTPRPADGGRQLVVVERGGGVRLGRRREVAGVEGRLHRRVTDAARGVRRRRVDERRQVVEGVWTGGAPAPRRATAARSRRAARRSPPEAATASTAAFTSPGVAARSIEADGEADGSGMSSGGPPRPAPPRRASRPMPPRASRRAAGEATDGAAAAGAGAPRRRRGSRRSSSTSAAGRARPPRRGAPAGPDGLGTRGGARPRRRGAPALTGSGRDDAASPTRAAASRPPTRRRAEGLGAPQTRDAALIGVRSDATLSFVRSRSAERAAPAPRQGVVADGARRRASDARRLRFVVSESQRESVLPADPARRRRPHDDLSEARDGRAPHVVRRRRRPAPALGGALLVEEGRRPHVDRPAAAARHGREQYGSGRVVVGRHGGPRRRVRRRQSNRLDVGAGRAAARCRRSGGRGRRGGVERRPDRRPRRGRQLVVGGFERASTGSSSSAPSNEAAAVGSHAAAAGASAGSASSNDAAGGARGGTCFLSVRGGVGLPAAAAGRGGSANAVASKEARADGGGSSSAGGSLKSAPFNTDARRRTRRRGGASSMQRRGRRRPS